MYRKQRFCKLNRSICAGGQSYSSLVTFVTLLEDGFSGNVVQLQERQAGFTVIKGRIAGCQGWGKHNLLSHLSKLLQGYAPIRQDYEDFYTRRLYYRVHVSCLGCQQHQSDNLSMSFCMTCVNLLLVPRPADALHDSKTAHCGCLMRVCIEFGLQKLLTDWAGRATDQGKGPTLWKAGCCHTA